jgi:membrane protease YdiL (CAAX protease family)
MGTVTSPQEVLTQLSANARARLTTSAEVLLVYAGILLYIWRWQFSYPGLWMPMLAFVVASHFIHRDSLHDLGLTARRLRESASLVLPVALGIFAPLVVYGFASGRLVPAMLNRRVAAIFAAYLLWCFFQQYLLQSYFHHRLLGLMRNPHLSSVTVALMFGAAHIPNPVLMVATTLGGFVFAEVFARHRSIWALALAQAAGGFLIGALVPPEVIHNMRVGPGYFFYDLR